MKLEQRTPIPPEHQPVLVAGTRTPFLESAGLYAELMSYELGSFSLAALLDRSGVPADAIELVVMGTVLHEVETTNVAREAMLAAGLHSRTPAYTVAMAGISPNVGFVNIADQIALGRLKLGIAAGTENFSDIPIRLSQNIRRGLMKLRQRKQLGERLKVLASLRPGDLTLEIPQSSDYTTGLTMGEACERMVKGYGATREASDRYAAEAHARAIAARDDGRHASQIAPVRNKAGALAEHDNSPRADASVERLAGLKPVFDPAHGIITAGNASRFTDGAGALLLASQEEAARRQLRPMALVRDHLLSGVDSLQDEMLFGPAMTIPRLLAQNGLHFEDIDVWELHEAFAAQILINIDRMADADFIAERHGADVPHGRIPLERLNTWGGSLSLGNPFAATGCRLLLTAAQRLEQAQARFAVVSTCAGGGLGAAILLERPGAA
ncbi:MAG: thiolase family protein [Algiphilus sp.]|uniref:thiolase family protein n=1 Tax=Algiphilus sp. TaxID=1872431 RepID=UPI0032EF79E7